MPFSKYPEELSTALLDTLPDPVMVKDDALRYVWVNHACAALYGLTRSEIIGKLDDEIFAPGQSDECTAGDRRALSSGAIDEAYQTIHPKGQEPRMTRTRKTRLDLSDGTRLVVGVMHDVTDVMRANRELEEASQLLNARAEELQRMADTDHLTGCLTRRAFVDRAEQEMQHRACGLLLIDIDHFKAINDTYGHNAGDAALVHFTALAKAAIRNGDHLARVGGEEFAVLIPGAAPEDLRTIGERMRTRVAASDLRFGGQTIRMTVSIGGSMLRGAGENTIDALLQEADRCLYAAKRGGRDRLVLAA
ncbi:MAG: GGDEF domain-containing protein [Pseudomonadota bacterium]